jgi:hypothetical protein
LRAEVGSRAGGGQALAQIDDEVIAPSALSEEQKSTLWLYGWACREQGRRRYDDRQSQFRRRASRLAEVGGD